MTTIYFLAGGTFVEVLELYIYSQISIFGLECQGGYVLAYFL